MFYVCFKHSSISHIFKDLFLRRRLLLRNKHKSLEINSLRWKVLCIRGFPPKFVYGGAFILHNKRAV